MNHKLSYLAAPLLLLFLTNTSLLAQPLCAAPLNFRVDDVFDTYVKLRWASDPVSQNPAVSWRIIYGPQGFDLAAGAGDTATSLSPKITITGLQKKTWHDAYIEQYCGLAGGYSERIGPISFQTYWTKDVGIIGVVSPVSDCELGSADSVRVQLKNFGSNPYSLIPLRYTLNDMEVIIPKPSDGVYTDVLGKDSVITFTFEATSDFSDPGEYKIVAYTKFSGDEDRSNDTFTYYLTNRLLSPYAQSFEDWNGGWRPTGNNVSFEHGTPNKTSIPAAAVGQKAWVTSLSNAYNANEHSYLESPCFDFANLTVDPAIEFSLIYDLENGVDGVWLEISTNNGQTWAKVGGLFEGNNWYNTNIPTAGNAWSGNSGGWVSARHFLTGAAGESEVRLRFVFASNATLNLGGLGIDQVRIFPAFNKDLLGSVVAVSSENDICGLEEEPVTFTFINIGAQTQSNFQVAYSVNGGAPVVENPGFTIAPDQFLSYSFNTTFDSRDKRAVVKCWTKLNGDFAPANDTATYIIDHRPTPAPFQENFENQALPTGWASDGIVTNGHGNTSYVLAENMKASNPDFKHDTPRYGPLGINDSLVFSYRIVNFSGGGATLLSAGTKFEIQVSTDCGDSFQTLNTINNSNHSLSTNLQQRRISLLGFAGQSIIIRVLGTWTFGDFWFDLDNINLLSCPADMAIVTSVVHADPGQANGAASVNPTLGNPPFGFLWSNGATSPSIDGLSSSTYTVTITDAYGCSSSAVISIGTSAVAAANWLQAYRLQPNPSSGKTQLEIIFEHQVAQVRVQVVNLLGQTVWETSLANTDRVLENIDLTAFADGIYLVQVMADGQVVSKKLLKTR